MESSPSISRLIMPENFAYKGQCATTWRASYVTSDEKKFDHNILIMQQNSIVV